MPTLRSTTDIHRSFFLSASPARTALAKARSILRYTSNKIHKGNQTQSVLKKTRYTQRYMKLLVSRLGLPVSHSGAKVMKPPYSSPVARTVAQNHSLPPRSLRLINSQIYNAKGPAPNTVRISRLITVRSAPPHRLSAFAYSCHSLAVGLVP